MTNLNKRLKKIESKVKIQEKKNSKYNLEEEIKKLELMTNEEHRELLIKELNKQEYFDDNFINKDELIKWREYLLENIDNFDTIPDLILSAVNNFLPNSERHEFAPADKLRLYNAKFLHATIKVETFFSQRYGL